MIYNLKNPGKLYGGYFQDLHHAPELTMLVSPRSCNTEALERMQRRAKQIGLGPTNQHRSEVLLRFLAEQEGSHLGNTYVEVENWHSYHDFLFF